MHLIVHATFSMRLEEENNSWQSMNIPAETRRILQLNSQTTDQPMAPRGKDTEQADTRQISKRDEKQSAPPSSDLGPKIITPTHPGTCSSAKQ